ncbi:MAG TPA: ribokinase [Anaerolineales bacterium]
MKSLTIVGSLNMDLVVRAGHLPASGETILGRDFRTIPGGKGANQAVSAARLGGKVQMVGRVGQDSNGEILRSNLKAEGIVVDFVETDPALPSGVALITLDEAGNNTIVVASGANMAIAPQDVSRAFGQIASMDALVMQLESPLDCVLAAARLGRQRGACVVLNPAPARPLSVEIYQSIDVLVPNETETSLLTGLPVNTLEQAETAGRRLLELGAGKVVLTLGSRGALAFEPGKDALHIPSHVVEVVDTTAAGDAFVAGLAVGLAEGMSLPDATRLGNAAGAVAVTRLGAQPSMPTRQEVLQLLGRES